MCAKLAKFFEKGPKPSDRLNSPTGLDLQAVAAWVEKASPFLGLLAVVQIISHFKGLACIAWLTVVLVAANKEVRKQAALEAVRQVVVLVGIAAGLLLHVCLSFALFQRDKHWLNFVLLPANARAKVSDVVFEVIFMDLLARLVGMAVKTGALLALDASTDAALRQRSRVLTCLEHSLLLYRSLLPLPVWYDYFDGLRFGSILSTAFAGAYMLLKSSHIIERLQLVWAAGRAMMLREAAYGTMASAEEVMESGPCAICQEAMQEPTRLHCGHIFCEGCINEWFERDSGTTCPMCRAVVKPAGLQCHGDASTSLLPVVF
ncbi:hypothetical protein WJX72_008829 [[Myrmecia] bisecta]|uniref:RING-type domain-containing protein n=1 Tax=[Myrmecia] bisecta TaxID=41462 RepID=A0AAW1PKI3_9CHLO